MTVISDLVNKIRSTAKCTLFPASGVPTFGLAIPTDLMEFYTLCGGADLFIGSDYAVTISAPQDLRPSNEVILGEQFPEDRSANWYVIASCSPREHISIDLSSQKLGRCYDSFDEVHAVAGSCAVVSQSFSEFLQRTLDNNGGYYYWLHDSFQSYGDAYD